MLQGAHIIIVLAGWSHVIQLIQDCLVIFRQDEAPILGVLRMHGVLVLSKLMFRHHIIIALLKHVIVYLVYSGDVFLEGQVQMRAAGHLSTVIGPLSIVIKYWHGIGTVLIGHAKILLAAALR